MTMDIDSTKPESTDARMALEFGDLSRTMLDESSLRNGWRLNFLANFFVGPIYRALDARFGVSRPEFVILFCLSQRPGLVARDVCRVTGLPKNSISRAVSQLLARGLIERQPSAADKREKTLAMTADGQALLAQLVPYFKKREDDMRAVLSTEERAEFDRLLMKIIHAMPDWVTIE